MTITQHLSVHAIDPARLALIRSEGTDGYGNKVRALAAAGNGEPLRCCLRYATAGEQIALISYAPLDHPSLWTEVGPVYIHWDICAGYQHADSLPTEFSAGPRVLRTYRADDTMNYDHNTVVTDYSNLEPILVRLLEHSDVATVHVRALASQCYLFAVTAK